MHSVMTNATGSTAMGKGVDDMMKSRKGEGTAKRKSPNSGRQFKSWPYSNRAARGRGKEGRRRNEERKLEEPRGGGKLSSASGRNTTAGLLWAPASGEPA